MNMNGADIADQLRNHYRIDRWMRKRKWWWRGYALSTAGASTIGYFCVLSTTSSTVEWGRARVTIHGYHPEHSLSTRGASTDT